MEGYLRMLPRRLLNTLRPAGRLVAGINISIRMKILLSLCIVIVMMGATNILLMLQLQNYSQQYDLIITNITTANSISGTIKPAIDAEIWKIVAGTQDFSEGMQYQIIGDAVAEVQQMMANTDSPKAKLKLDVILRTMQTLTESVDAMGQQIEKKSTAAENETALENIRFITSVLDAGIQDYVLFEVQRTNLQYEQMRAGFIQWEISYVILMVGSVCFSVLAAWGISGSIYRPIRKLHDVTSIITKQDLQALVTHDNVDEITEMGISFNIMIGKIRELLDSKIKEQENLKKAELRALQAQINPHFLYNTLDTIIWMAEAKKNDQVIEIVSALSNFFRISLSKGQDWITVREEIERTKSYLTIQKIRYRDILDFQIEAEEQVLKNTVLKLVLQPLVENALYHGVKNKRQGGTIILRAKQNGEDEVVFEVEDNGIGFTPSKLAQVRAELAADTGDIRMESGFGIGNVNKRIKLYYGKQYGLSIESEYNMGTRVRLVIPTIQDVAARSA
jgi:two-component system sensor histidine kinase YesM